MKKLIKGIVNFRQNSLSDYTEKFSQLAATQPAPDALFIACCDSRVVPNVFASTDPGDLFVIRNLGNLVPKYCEMHSQNMDISTAAAIEFACLSLHVADIVICGHSECAAMQTLFKQESKQQFPFLNTWLQTALPSYERFQHTTPSSNRLSAHNHLSQINVLQQLEHLKTYPWVNQQLMQHQVRIHGWWFDLATAGVYHYNDSVKDFVLIDEVEAGKMLSELGDETAKTPRRQDAKK